MGRRIQWVEGYNWQKDTMGKRIHEWEDTRGRRIHRGEGIHGGGELQWVEIQEIGAKRFIAFIF